MKKNDGKYWRNKFFDCFRKKSPEPPEKRSEPAKTVAPETSVEKEKTSAPLQDVRVLRTDEKKIPRYAADSVKGDGNILESVRKTDQLKFPFRNVKYRLNISFKDIGKEYFYRDYIIKDLVTAEDGHDYVRELSAGCYDGANGRPVSYCSETYTGRGVEKRYDWELGFYPLPSKIECAFEERFPPLSEKPEEAEQEKTFALLGSYPAGKGDNVWIMKREDQFEMIIVKLGESRFEPGCYADIVPDDVICTLDLEVLSDWMYANPTHGFNINITAREEDYRSFLIECGVTESTKPRPYFTFTLNSVLNRIKNSASKQYYRFLGIKEPHNSIGSYSFEPNEYDRYDISFYKGEESGSIYVQWWFHQIGTGLEYRTVHNLSDIYLLDYSVYHKIMDMLGAVELKKK